MLTGAGGADTLDGGGGIDTAVYAGSLALADIVATGGGGWTALMAGPRQWHRHAVQTSSSSSTAADATCSSAYGGFATQNEAALAAETQPGDTIVFATAPSSVTINVASDHDIDLTDQTVDVPTDITITGIHNNHITTGDGDDHIVTGDGGNDVIKTGAGNDSSMPAPATTPSKAATA